MFDKLNKSIFDTVSDKVKDMLDGDDEVVATPKKSSRSKVVRAVEEVREAVTGKEAVIAEHTVRSGDTLSGIAQHYYGNAGLWSEVYEYNKAVIGSNPNMIQVGQVFEIPNLD